MKNLLDEFESPDKSLWLKQVEKELKKELGDTTFSAGLNANVFVSHEDRLAISPEFRKKQSAWILCQKAQSNLEIKTALEGGANAIHLEIDKIWTRQDFENNFSGIFLNFITLRLSFNHSNAQQFIDGLLAYCSQINIETSELKIIVANASNLNTGNIQAFYQIDADKNLDLIPRLADVLRKAEQIGIENSALSITAEENFYLNIAQTKVLKILSAKINEAYGKESISAMVLVNILENNKESDPNLQAIMATSQCLASIVGGADLIEIKNLRYTSEKYSSSFGPRITRNIQNIVLHESFLNRVDDASKGSYFLDELCTNLMNEVWKIFIKD